MGTNDIRIVGVWNERTGRAAAEFHLPGHLLGRRLEGFTVVYKTLRWSPSWGPIHTYIELDGVYWRILAVRVTGPDGAWAEAKVVRDGDGKLALVLASEPSERLMRALKDVSRALTRGRPLGTAAYSPEEFERAYREAYARQKRLYRRPRQEQVAGEMGISVRTLQRYLKDWRLPWPPAS